MEDSIKSEDTEFNNAISVCPQVNQTYSDTKFLVDNKNTQIRIVRGNKKLKIDNSDPNNIEKKGAYIDVIDNTTKMSIYNI